MGQSREPSCADGSGKWESYTHTQTHTRTQTHSHNEPPLGRLTLEEGRIECSLLTPDPRGGTGRPSVPVRSALVGGNSVAAGVVCNYFVLLLLLYQTVPWFGAHPEPRFAALAASLLLGLPAFNGEGDGEGTTGEEGRGGGKHGRSDLRDRMMVWRTDDIRRRMINNTCTWNISLRRYMEFNTSLGASVGRLVGVLI